MNEQKVEKIKLSLVKLNEHNPREISPTKFEQLIDSILTFPKMLKKRPLVIDGQFVVLGGNMRTLALREIAKMSFADVTARLEGIQSYNERPQADRVVTLEFWRKWFEKPFAYTMSGDDLTAEEKAHFTIVDNVSFGKWDFTALANEWDEHLLQEWGVDVWADGANNETGGGDNMENGNKTPQDKEKHGNLAERFVVPPFSVLDTKQGYWQQRKKEWLELTGNLSETRNGEYGTVNGSKNNIYTGINDGTSNFDPVLAEVIMTWFCPKNGKVLDPFGGEQTKGVVAGELGLQYEAVEFRSEQVELNRERTKQYEHVQYTTGDSNNIAKLIKTRGFNLCFTSPPYFDLEVYSKEDMSALGTYEEFMRQYENIFKQCYDMLADNSFMVVKVAEIRDKKTGVYRNFVGDNITLFTRLGFKYYNEIILYNIIGTGALRANLYMNTRKVVKVHQNVLVFYKGKIKDIAKHYASFNYKDEDLNNNDDEG